jgi:flagellar basal-body rod modification protein FlgD
MQVTSNISPLTTTRTATPTATAPAAASSPNSTLSETQFLQLLTEQLENQDPLQPEDDTQFLAQMAQFTSLQEANTTNQQLSNLTASNYIGSMVTVNPGSGTPVTGQVTGVDTSGSTPNLIINGSEYPLSELQLVQPFTAASAPTTSSSPAPASAAPSSTTASKS